MDDDELLQIIVGKDDEIAALFERIAELESAARRFSEWQPIETATDDGTRILLARYVGNPAHESALWWMAAGVWSEKYQNWNDGVTPEAFVCPTHWMPLPSPPPPVREPVRTTGAKK